MKARLGLGLVLAVIVLLGYPGAIAVALATRLAAPPAAPAAAAPAETSWLHVEHPASGRPYIADAFRRMVILHGAIPGSLVEFGGTNTPVYPVDPSAYANGRCPANDTTRRYPPLCFADLLAMARLGFNSIRLPVSWSLLEPRRGAFDQVYIDRIAQVVGWARAAGLYVIVDMHQNGYSPYVGASDSSVSLGYNSGAPAWATFTDGLPSHVIGGQRELNPAVFEAATNFWYDREGIQDAYIEALGVLVRRFKDDSTVAGYGVYNEPWPGWTPPPAFEDLLLFPFYRRVIDAMTGVHDGLPCWSGFFLPAVCGYRDLGIDDRRQLFFLDTGLEREVTDFPTHLGLPVSSYPNLVLAMHAYTHVYTIDSFLDGVLHQNPADATYPFGGYDQSYGFADREAAAMGAALFVAEFGNDPMWDDLELRNQLAEAQGHRVGFAFWTWKENDSKAWGIFDPARAGSPASSGCLRPDRERMLAGAYPQAVADPNASFAFDGATGAFHLSAQGRAGDAPTVVEVPGEVTGTVSARGAVTLTVADRAGGGRLVTALPSVGRYTVDVEAAPALLTGCG